MRAAVMTTVDEAADAFSRHRPLLFTIAYEMLGSSALGRG